MTDVRMSSSIVVSGSGEAAARSVPKTRQCPSRGRGCRSAFSLSEHKENRFAYVIFP